MMISLKWRPRGCPAYAGILTACSMAMAWSMAVALVCAAPSYAQSPMDLSIDDAITIGLQKNRVLKISEARVDAASAKAGEAGAGLLPSVKFSAGYTRLSDVDPFRITVPFSPQPITIAPTVLDNYSVRATVQQPLFTGFRLENNARAADYLMKANEYDHRSDKADLFLNIISAYWTLYQTLEVKKFVDENVGRLQSYQYDTENLLKAGMATRNDLLKIQVQLNSATLAQIDAANDVQLATMNLNNTIGQSLDLPLHLTSSPRSTTGSEQESMRENDTTGSSVNLASKALTARSDLQAMQSRIEAAKAGVRAANANWWPQLFLSGNYYYSRPNPRYQPTMDEFKSTWDFGVQLQVDLWNWGTTGFQAEQAKAALMQTEYAFEQMKDVVSLDVKRQSLAVRRAEEKIRVARLAIAQADENARSTRDKFQQGLASSSELLDATVALLQATTNLSAAFVESEVARTRLKRAIGDLD